MAYQALNTLPDIFKAKTSVSFPSTANSTSSGVQTPANVGYKAPGALSGPTTISASTTPTTQSYSQSKLASTVPIPPSMGVRASSPSDNLPKATQTPTVPISNVDNVNHTYMQGDQKYALDQGTGRFEAVQSVPAQMSQTYTPPVQPQTTEIVTSPQSTTSSTQQPSQDVSYGGLLQQLVKQSQMSPQELELNQRLSDLAKTRAEQVGQERMMPETNAYQTGRTGIIEQINNAQQQNVAQQSQNLAKQREVATSALGTAAGYAKPITMQYGQSLVNPQSGSDISAGQPFSGLQGLTNLGIANNNISQGNTYAGQASQLSTTLSQLDTLAPKVAGFLQKAGINPEQIPLANESMKTYIAKIQNPADAASANAMFADIKTYMSQIMGASGLNPTEVSATVNSFDPSALNPQQFSTFVNNLKSLGQMRLQPLQQSAQGAYGTNGYSVTPYTGTPASSENTFANSPNTTTSQNGGFASSPQDFLKILTGGVINAATSGAGALGAIAGIAKSFFK